MDTSEVEEYLKQLQEKMKDLRPVWKDAANIMRRSFADNFRAGGRPERWERLKSGTIWGKAYDPNAVYGTMRGRARIRRLEQARGGSQVRSLSNILILSGKYRDSWVQKTADHVELISKDRLETGSKHPLVEIHEFGTGVRGPHGRPFVILPRRAKSLRWWGQFGPVFARKVINPGVPPRPVGIIQDEDLDKITRRIEEHLE